MSYTTSIIAGRTAPEGLRDAVVKAWPKIRVADEKPGLQSFEEFVAWRTARKARGRDAKAFYKEGSWAVLVDLSMTMCANDQELAALSKSLGKVVVATTQGTGGFAEIRVFDAGREIRRITSDDGEVTEEGSPLPEERGLDLNDFDMGANEEIAKRLGLESFWGEIPPPILGVEFAVEA